MVTRTGTAVLAVLIALSLAVVPLASAHTNQVAADSQVSADGTVTAELVYTVTDSWVVAHRDDAGSPGEPIGHALVESGGGAKTDVGVDIDEAAWSEWNGSRTVHLVMHNADGDGAFDPDSDPILTSGDEPVAATITVERGEESAVVTAQQFEPPTVNGTVTVRTVGTPVDGHLVLRDGSADGAVVGSTALDAGRHGNVTVTLNESFYRQQGEAFALSAVVHRDDGSGAPGAPVTAGDSPVATTFEVVPADTSTPTATPTETTADDHDDHEHEDDGTETEGDGHEDRTREEATATETATAAETGTTDAGGEAQAGGAETPTDAEGPGPGVVGALAALVAAALLARRAGR